MRSFTLSTASATLRAPRRAASPTSCSARATRSAAFADRSIYVDVALWLAFRFSLRGKALRATAIDRFGARLVGISPARAGRLTFAVAALLAALAGMLAAPGTTLFYDSGLVIGLKGFVAAVAGGLLSYPAAAAAALGLGLIESFGSFYASAYKEAVVFTAILPVLLWLSIRHRQAGGEA